MANKKYKLCLQLNTINTITTYTENKDSNIKIFMHQLLELDTLFFITNFLVPNYIILSRQPSRNDQEGMVSLNKGSRCQHTIIFTVIRLVELILNLRFTSLS